MKKSYFFPLLISLFACSLLSAQNFCDLNGNIAIYSNYDGGPLTINVDQNIPNLKIGIVSYEFARINITGTYAGNVTEVRWVGYNGSNNHCSLSTPYTTTITGVPNNVDTIIVMPPASLSNPNGYNLIICNYSCDDSTNQGGCNTPDQIVDYFVTHFNGTLYFHYTQYGCWSGTYNISAGGNCCIAPVTTGISDAASSSLHVSPNPSDGLFRIDLPAGFSSGRVHVFNALGEEIRAMAIENSSSFAEISLRGENAGMYFVQVENGKQTFNTRLVLTE